MQYSTFVVVVADGKPANLRLAEFVKPFVEPNDEQRFDSRHDEA
jgi:hypothetical protein